MRTVLWEAFGSGQNKHRIVNLSTYGESVGFNVGDFHRRKKSEQYIMVRKYCSQIVCFITELLEYTNNQFTHQRRARGTIVIVSEEQRLGVSVELQK